MKSIMTLVVEVTRRCNMHCEHCLRGDFEDCCMDADFNMIPEIFEGIERIGTIVFTGGEPSLNHRFITACVDYIEKNSIFVDGVFIATNGMIYCQELVDAVRRLWLLHTNNCFLAEKVHYSSNESSDYCNRYDSVSVNRVRNIVDEERYMFSIAVSMDRFHESIPMENYLKYLTCGFYSDSKVSNMTDSQIIPRGRGMDVADGRNNRDISEMYFDDDGNPEEVYVSCDGKVFGECDLSFEMMNDENAVGTIIPGQESLENILFKAWQEYLDT